MWLQLAAALVLATAVGLTAWALLHASTRGAAQALRLGHEIGCLEPGAVADLCLWNWAVGPVAQRRDSLARALHERLFAWVTLADERNLESCWVAGQARYPVTPDPARPLAPSL